MTHDDATHIDPNDALHDALRALRHRRANLIEKIKTYELQYTDAKSSYVEGERHFDDALRTSVELTEALQQNTLSIWRIEWKLARSQDPNQIADLRDAQDVP